MMAKIVVVGLGPIGREMVRALHGRATAQIVGAADPAHAGKDLGELAGIGKLGLTIASSASEAYVRSRGNISLLCTTSHVSATAAQVEEAVNAGYSVVSTSESLSFPERENAGWAEWIDRLAKEKKAGVLGVGVNPGFVMDRMPLALAATCVRVETIAVERVVDAAKRRGPLQAKVGAGLSPEAFRAGVEAGTLGHVGLVESVLLVARGMGWTLDTTHEDIDFVVSTHEAPRAGIEVGRVAGVHQIARGLRGGRAVITLDLEMSVAAPDPRDRIQLTGDPPLDVVFRGGTHGDRGTVGAAINAIPRLLSATPGLHHIYDLPLFGVLP
jgi:4-hydroxy-tetrahydrodipicolinate reductase